MKMLGKKLMLATLLAGAALPAWPAAFTPRNLVVEQVGDGTVLLTTNAAPIILDEFTTAGTQVQSIAVPSSGPNALVDTGANNYEGIETLSGNGQYLILAGYNTNSGVVKVSTNSALAVPRAAGYVDCNGVYTLGPISTNDYSKSSIMSATSDGYGNFWAAGSGGLFCLSKTNANSLLSSYPLIKVIGGNLYSIYGGTYVASSFGTPTTVALGNNIGCKNLATVTSKFPKASPRGFVFNPAMTVLYVAVSNPYTNATTCGGVEVWTNNPTKGVFGYDYTLAYGTNGATGLEADFSQANPVIYGTSADGNSLFSIVDTGVGGNSTGTLLATAAANTAFRSVSFAPTNGPALPTVTLTAVTNYNYAAVSGNISVPINEYNTTLVTFYSSIYATGGPVTCAWYFETATTTNLITGTNLNGAAVVGGATNNYLYLSVLNLTNSGNYQLAVTDSLGNSVTSAPVSLTVYIAPPTVSIPAPQTTKVGGQVIFQTTIDGSLLPSFTYQWYFEPVSTNVLRTDNLASFYTPGAYNEHYVSVTATNLIPGATNYSLLLTNLVATNAGNYVVVVADAWGLNATSAPQALIITGDPNIVLLPNQAEGVVGGQVQFNVYGGGSSPLSYQWYFSDPSGNLIAPATSLGDGSVLTATNISSGGLFTSTLTFSNLQPNSITNFVLVVANPYGSATSSVASMLTGYGTAIPYTQGVLALWDFDGQNFTNNAIGFNLIKVPFVGGGTAAKLGGIVEFDAYTDPDDQGEDLDNGEWVFTPYGFEQPAPNGSWGTLNYPQGPNGYYGTNKTAGVQFNISTVGARNILINYEARAGGAASKYFRLQYTIDGANWIDYPASICFDGQYTSSYSGGFFPFSYDLTGFPGVDNNPNFGFRIVAEFESTATYGVIPYDILVGNVGAYQYGTDDAVSYDIVAVQGDAITNSYTPPVLSGFVNTNMIVTNTLNLNFTATDAWMSASNLTFNVQYPYSESPWGVEITSWSPNYTVQQTGPTNFQLQISFPLGGSIPDPIDATPVVITATDTNGESAVAWFDLTVNPTPISYLSFVGAPSIIKNWQAATTNLTFVAANIGGGTEYLLGTTNLATPISQWTPLWTNGLSWTNAPDTIEYTTNVINMPVYLSLPQLYFILSTQNGTNAPNGSN